MDVATADTKSTGFVQDIQRLLKIKFDAFQVVGYPAANSCRVLRLTPKTKPSSG